MNHYDMLKKELEKMATQMLDDTVKVISSRPLTPEEAIGRPDRTDYPILKGKEFMIEATFRDAKGQAFTDMPGNFQSTLQDILDLELKDNFERAVFIAGFNAVMRYSGRVDNTIHCKNSEPKACAEKFHAFIMEHFGKPRIAFIGYQPAMIERLSASFEFRVVDLDRDNIGAKRFGLIIEGPESTADVLEWSDIILATGSTCVNNTIADFLNKKPVIFYGVTIAGFAFVYGYRRFCPYGK